MTLPRIFLVGVFVCLGVYLFATAPEPLPDGDVEMAGCRHPVNAVFDGVNVINEVARTVYTKRIVGGGKAAGLKFGEEWQEPGVEQGPLPALFLRATAAHLETLPPRLGLYLGSDAPINKSNLFGAAQLSVFDQIKASRAAVYSEDPQSGFVAMYPDVAGVAPCVTCHNAHPDSPKKDWKLNDVMGATTWTYPAAEVTVDEFLDVVDAMYASVAHAYDSYLTKAAGFEAPVQIGAEWPREGARVLPEVNVFLSEVKTHASPAVLEALMRDRRHPDGQPAQDALAAQADGGQAPCGF
jgi:adenylate cyclase